MALNIRLTDKVSNVNEEDELRKRGYILGVTLGEGSYAKVKSAFSEKHDRKIALKIINRRKAPKDFQTRFLPRELEILKQIIHPNIIRLFDVMRFNNKVRDSTKNQYVNMHVHVHVHVHLCDVCRFTWL